jgi:hypothetical protein
MFFGKRKFPPLGQSDIARRIADDCSQLKAATTRGDLGVRIAKIVLLYSPGISADGRELREFCEGCNARVPGRA